jgi:hypothetical protein
MSIEQEKIIDILASGQKLNEAILIVSDHLPWDDEASYEHAILLQKKINSYLAFIEGGEMDKEYPEHKGKLVVIKVLGKYPLSEKAKEFYEKASHIVTNAGFQLKYEHSPE